MNGPMRAALIAALCLGWVIPSKALANDTVDRARSLLAKGDARSAVVMLEEALPTAGADLGPMVVVLRQAYTRAADQAAKAGKPDEAEEYRENLQILNRRLRGKTEDPKLPEPTPQPQKPAPKPVETPSPAKVVETPLPAALAPPGALAIEPPPTAPVAPAPEIRHVETQPEVERVPNNAPVAQEPATAATAPAGTDFHAIQVKADRAYLAEQYLDAAAGYAALAETGKLPEDRKIHWAYCRSVAVVRQIKAKPATAEEWAAIDREIVAIKTLSPRYWYAEYLRNRAADQSRAVAKQPRGRVVRGAMPEEDQPATNLRDLTRKATPVDAQPAAPRVGKPGDIALAPGVPSSETPAALSTHGDASNWQIIETANFVIFHANPALAERVAKAAEAARDAQFRRWSGSPPPRPWSPRCEIYLYPTAAIFAQVTHQPAESPGYSTMQSDGRKVTGRRVNLRADHPTLVNAVLPHEVTHVLLADLFPSQQIPRWADEGIAVLAEPKSEQERRIADLDNALKGGKVFSLANLMVREYPEGPHWPLYYAQSVSLTRFLVELGTPGQFIDFVQGCQRADIENELRRVYQIEGVADLQSRWLAYAQNRQPARVATSRE